MIKNILNSIKSFLLGTLGFSFVIGFYILKVTLFGMIAAGGWHLYNYLFGEDQKTLEKPDDFKRIKEILQEKLNEHLPKRLDETTVLNSINIINNYPYVIVYNYSFIKEDGNYITIQNEDAKDFIKKSIISYSKKNFCENLNTKSFRALNFSAQYIYHFNENDTFSVQVSNSDCHS